MRQPESRSAVTSFLSALVDDLSAPPDEMTARRHVTAAAAIVRSERRASSSRAVRFAAAVLISVMGVGTSGVAVAGGLPAPLQEVAADVGRVLPFPILVPYPTPADESPRPARVQRRPLDGEIDFAVEPVEGAGTETITSSPPASPGRAVADHDPELGDTEQAEGRAHGPESDLQDVSRWRDDDFGSGDSEEREKNRSQRDDQEEESSGEDSSEQKGSDESRSDDDRSDDGDFDDDRSDEDGSDDGGSDHDNSDNDSSDRG